MKKTILSGVVLAMLLGLIACGGDGPAPTKQTNAPTQPSTTAPATAPAEDAELVEARYISKISCVWPMDGTVESSWSKEYRCTAYSPVRLELWDDGMLSQVDTFHPTGCEATSEGYDEEGRKVESKTYDADGNLLTHTVYDEVGTEQEVLTYTYEEGLLTKKTAQYADGDLMVDSYAYDDAGRMTEHTEYENVQKVAHESWLYDDAGNMLEERRTGEYEGEPWFSYTTCVYDADGKLTEKSESGSDLINDWDHRIVYTYDEEGRQIQWQIVDSDEAGVGVTDTYDDAGHLTGRVERSYVDGWSTTEWSFTYDDAGRLTEQKMFTSYDDSPVTTEQRSVYTYDDAGNVTQRIDYYDGEEELRQDLRYDDAGRMIEKLCYEQEVEVYRFACQYAEDGTLTEVLCDGFESLRQQGEELKIMETEDGDLVYAAISYQSVTATEEEAAALEKVNEHILDTII